MGYLFMFRQKFVQIPMDGKVKACQTHEDRPVPAGISYVSGIKSVYLD